MPFGSLCSVIAGAKSWFDIREYILGHHDWFKNNNLFESGIPADDTIARIISTTNNATNNKTKQ
ncbi:MAG: spore cortex formation protein SpoVR/YcgB (stage V sporulation) [Alteromonadaceae bacterium]